MKNAQQEYSILGKQIFQIQGTQYQILPKVLGQGSFGRVHLGINTRSGMKVAIKCSQVSKVTQNEIQVLQLLRYQEDSIRFEGFYDFQKKKQKAIVLEHFENSLRQLMNKYNQFEQRTSLKILQKILGNLDLLRKHKILHRDLKPDNIFINGFQTNKKQYKLKIGDFGLALLEKDKKNKFLSKGIGTSQYMAPEVIQSGDYSQKSEVWSVGVIIYELTYRKFPFSEQAYTNINKMYEKLINCEIKFKENTSILNKICRECLIIQVNKRPSIQKLKKLVSEELQTSRSSTDDEKYQYNQELIRLVRRLIGEIISLISKQRMNEELANKIQKEWTSILAYEEIALLLGRRTISLIKKCLEWFTQVFSYSINASQINLNLNQFKVIDSLQILRKCCNNHVSNPQNCQNSLKKHFSFGAKSKGIQYYQQLQAHMTTEV